MNAAQKPETGRNTQFRWAIPVISRRTFSSQQQRRCVKNARLPYLCTNPRLSLRPGI